MKLILHIGTGRTGTQSIQDITKKNIDVIEKAGVHYPILERRNHHNALALPLVGANPPRYLRNRYGSDVETNLNEFSKFFDLIASSAASSSCDTCLLSSEFLGRVFDQAAGEIVFSKLRTIFSHITVLCYTRSPSSYYLSATMQTLKASGNLKTPEKQNIYRIAKSYEPFADEITIREFNRSTLLNGDVRQDYFNTIIPGLFESFGKVPPSKNESISAEIMEIIQEYRNQFWANADNQFNDETDRLLDYLVATAKDNELYSKPSLKPEIKAKLDCADTNLQKLKSEFGFAYSSVDYDSTSEFNKDEFSKLKRVRDVCEFSGTVKEQILIHTMHFIGSSLAKPNEAPPKKPFAPKRPPRKITSTELKRFENDVDLLRLPENEVWDRREAIGDLIKQNKITVRQSFPKLGLDEIKDWKINPQSDVVWRIYFNSFAWMTSFFSPLVPEAEKDKLVAKAKDLMFLFLDHMDEEIDKKNSDIWDDHATAYRLSYFSYAYMRGVAKILTPEENARLRSAVLFHQDKLRSYLDSSKWLMSNHTIFQVEGLADSAIAFLQNPERRKSTLEYCAKHLDEFVERAICVEEGSAREHAVFYHIFLMGRLKESMDYFSKIGISLRSLTPALFKKMFKFVSDISTETGKLPGIGDSKHEQRYDKKYLEHFDEIREEIDFTWPKYSLIEYKSDGYYIFKSTDPDEKKLQTVFLNRTFRGPHGHWDGMSLVLYYDGQPILIDSGGPYKYSNPYRYKYFQTQLAHNSLIVDKLPRKIVTKLLDKTETSAGHFILLGCKAAEDSYWYRCAGQTIDGRIVLLDIVNIKKGSQAALRFHLDPAAQLTHSKNKFVNAIGHVNATFSATRCSLPKFMNSVVELQVQETPEENFSEEDRLEARNLDPDFFVRSYVTYKDHQKVDGKLFQMPVKNQECILNTISFRDSDEEFKLDTSSDSINVIDKKSKAIAFSLQCKDGALRFS